MFAAVHVVKRIEKMKSISFLGVFEINFFFRSIFI